MSWSRGSTRPVCCGIFLSGAEKKSPTVSRKAEKRPGAQRRGEGSLRRQSSVHSGREMATDADVSSLAQLLQTLRREKIDFLIVGKSAAVLQGVPYSTLDTDIWVHLPPRQYIGVLNLCVGMGATVVANTVVILAEGTVVNFLYRVDGVRPFASEHRKAVRLEWMGQTVRVLPLERILASKQFVGRPKDLAHLPILRTFLACRDC